jgi:ABC-2 type transport system ATP-binding protein
MTTVAVDRLTKRYGATVAVDDLSFTVPAGSVTGFIGPNGAGKTTTLRALLGLTRPTAGRATFDGVPYAALADPARTVGAVLEHDPFHPGRSGRDHLRVLATASGVALARVDVVLGLVGLAAAARRPAGGYSLGMRRRLALAAALLGDPPVLLLDEPANGLDPLGMRWLRDLLGAHAARGATVLVSSHLLAEVALIADRVVVVDRGRLVASGLVGELTARGQTLEELFLRLTGEAG